MLISTLPHHRFRIFTNMPRVVGLRIIGLPACIFIVLGYRDEELNDAVVNGNGDVSTTGHEITYRFDEDAFNKRAKVMINQFSAYVPLPGYILLTDVHSPAKYRVNGPFASVDEFYNAFNVKPGDKMFLADSARVRIW